MELNLHHKIFIQIASYRDPQLNPTITDCLQKAKFPNRLSFGICRQDDLTETFPYSNDPRFRIINIPWQHSLGCCWARSQVQKLYAGETYTLQIDSHHRFAINWDETLIQMLESLTKCSNKPIITTYPAGFDPQDDQILPPDLTKMVVSGFNNDGILTFEPQIITESMGRPFPSRFMAGGFYFTYGYHCLECPYDPNLYFVGEEISLTVRSFTHGYDLFHPNQVILWHDYTPRSRPRHWEDHNQDQKIMWGKLHNISVQRVHQLLTLGNLEEYGLGSNRSLQDYEKYAGINFQTKEILPETLAGELPNIRI